MKKIAIKCLSKEHGKEILKYFESIGYVNEDLIGDCVGDYYFPNIICSSNLPDNFEEVKLDDLPKPLPRKMLVWDDEEENAKENLILTILPDNTYYPFISLNIDDGKEFKKGNKYSWECFKHAKELPSKEFNKDELLKIAQELKDRADELIKLANNI